MNSMLAALDLGHGWTKTRTTTGIWRQPSVLGDARPLFDDNITAKDVQYHGAKGGEAVDYFVGNLALRHSKIIYGATAEEKAKNWTTEILLKASLGLLAPNASLCVVTGLPVDAYFNQKEQMEELLESLNKAEAYELERGKEKIIAKPTVNACKIVPQPLGAAMNYLLDDAGKLIRIAEAKKNILVLDAGYYTFDILVLEAMQIGKDSSSPLGLGADTAYKLIQDYLKEQLGKAPGRYELDKYVRAGEYNGLDIKPLISKAFEALAAQIDLEIKQLNRHFDIYIVTGGWGSVIADFLTIPKDKVVIMKQLGNVDGYLKIGRRTWREVQ